MRTTTSIRLAITCLLGGACLAACSNKNDEPAPLAPDLKATFELSHYFDFTTTAPGGGIAHSGGGTLHAPQDITGTARLSAPASVLLFDFEAKPDAVHLEGDQAQLRPGWVGTYALRCQTRPADPVFVSYLYKDASRGVTTILRLSDWTSQLAGSVTISAYDTKRQLVSGSYDITAPSQHDPAASTSPSSPLCTVLLAGSFTNLKVQP